MHDISELLEQADRLKAEGKHRQAIQLCEQILAEEPLHVPTLEEIGDNYISLHDAEKAGKALQRALELNPESANACYLLGFLYSCVHEWRHSIEYLEKADALRANHPEVLRCLGWSLFQSGDVARGTVILERARTLEPEDVYILTDLGVCYLSEQKVEEARQAFDRVLTLDPDNEKARECLEIIENFGRALRAAQH